MHLHLGRNSGVHVPPPQNILNFLILLPAEIFWLIQEEIKISKRWWIPSSSLVTSQPGQTQRHQIRCDGWGAWTNLQGAISVPPSFLILLFLFPGDLDWNHHRSMGPSTSQRWLCHSVCLCLPPIPDPFSHKRTSRIRWPNQPRTGW